MDIQLSAHERKELAEACSLHDQYLYQCLTGRKEMEAKNACRVEGEAISRGLGVRRWHLRRDWREVWPELATTQEERRG